MTSASEQTLAFFGATGDCAGFCLAAALKAGYRCNALARTPSKLKASLQKKGVSEHDLRSLEIVQGDARDKDAVKQALSVNGHPVDKIISGIGSVPLLQWSLKSPIAVQDPTLCQDTIATIIKAIREMQSSKKPTVIVVSTTGLQPAGAPRDVPVLYGPLYSWLLQVPHMDKAHMEESLRAASYDTDKASVCSFVAVKPTLLTDGPVRDMTKIRAGVEDKPAIGYFIRRSEVGQWIFENLIQQTVRDDWLGKGISLTA